MLKWQIYFVSLHVTDMWLGCLACWNILWQLHHHVFSDCLLSFIGRPRGARSHRRLTPIEFWNNEKYSNSTYNSLLPMSVYAREMRYTHNKRFVSYLCTVAEKCSLLYTHTLYQKYKLLYIQYTLLCSWSRNRNSYTATGYVWHT